MRAQREKDGSRRETQTDGAAQDGPIPMTRSRNLTRTTSDDGAYFSAAMCMVLGRSAFGLQLVLCCVVYIYVCWLGIGAVDVVAYLKACTEAMLSGSHSGVVTPSREVNGRVGVSVDSVQ